MDRAEDNIKQLLEEIIRRAEAGEYLVLTSNGEKVAEVGASTDDALLRGSGEPTLPRIGALRNKIWIADDFDVLGPEWDEYIK